jgi:hypothetical protein
MGSRCTALHDLARLASIGAVAVIGRDLYRACLANVQATINAVEGAVGTDGVVRANVIAAWDIPVDASTATQIVFVPDLGRADIADPVIEFAWAWHGDSLGGDGILICLRMPCFTAQQLSLP